MKQILMHWIATATLLAASLHASCTTRPALPRPADRNFSTVSNPTRNLSSLLQIERITLLETVHEALLGAIDAVVVDPNTEELLVGDFYSTKSIYRFSPTGTFKRKYTFPALPGAPPLSGFEVMPDSSIVAISDRAVVHLAVDGTLVQSLRLPFLGHSVARAGTVICVVASRSLSAPNSVFCFDDRLQQLSEFHSPDSRIEQFAYLPHKAIAASGGSIFVTQYFSPQMTMYSPQGQLVRSMALPDLGADIADEFRSGARLDDAARKRVRRGIHRFQFVFGFDDGVFMLEVNEAHELRVPCVYVPSQDTLFRFPQLSVLTAPHRNGELTFDGVVGSYSRGVIGTMGDAAAVNRALTDLAKGDKQGHALQMKTLDNPAVVFSRVAVPK